MNFKFLIFFFTFSTFALLPASGQTVPQKTTDPILWSKLWKACSIGQKAGIITSGLGLAAFTGGILYSIFVSRKRNEISRIMAIYHFYLQQGCSIDDMIELQHLSPKLSAQFRLIVELYSGKHWLFSYKKHLEKISLDDCNLLPELLQKQTQHELAEFRVFLTVLAGGCALFGGYLGFWAETRRMLQKHSA